MGSQTKTFQRQVITAATKDGTLATLYWFIEITLPMRRGGGFCAVEHRGGLPVIPVAPDPMVSETYAELLRAMFEDANRGDGLTFSLALTAEDVITKECQKTGKSWYIYGESRTAFDSICPECGAVYSTEHWQPWACCGWSQVVVGRAEITHVIV